MRGAAVETGPPPRMTFQWEAEGRVHAEGVTYYVVKRNGVSVRWICDADKWPRFRDASAAVAASLRVELEEWPPHPPDFEREEVDGHLWYVQPGVDASAVRELKSLLRGVGRDFEKVHGKLRIDPESAAIITVCASRDAMRALSPDSRSDKYGADVDFQAGRLFLTPLPSDDGPEHADAAANYWRLLFIVTYGSHWPYWLRSGESEAAWCEERTGKRLPYVTPELRKKLPADPVSFSRLLEMETAETWDDPFDGTAAAYVLFFRAGPSKYRKAYTAFLREFAETRNVQAAAARHLGALDQERMRADLAKWLSRSVKTAKLK